MSNPTIADFVLPSAAAALLTILWAAMVFLPTYQIAKRIKQKWFASLAGTLAFLVVMIGGLSLGTFSWVVYWAGFKDVDITEPQEPVGAMEAVLDPNVWVILTPIIVPLLVLMPIAIRWKKAGETIGVRWA
ncbi:hypothetical protein PUV54_08080 [Hyphococcus flavus]|uniref:Uncharacterized protein n=1 Tax=Hyphococcus flavus TaxID=1866326 RepID=A0AAE9ZHG8_9PROT|nr:hypothetical protein [Hyphococcus flavus]WDI33153.1 hypothetical protein PUV54_08080 [Hyphococcus flavus]